MYCSPVCSFSLSSAAAQPLLRLSRLSLSPSLLVGGASSALQYVISLHSGWSVVSSGHQHTISSLADWCLALIGSDIPLWCVVLLPSGCGSTRSLFGLGMGPDNTSPWQGRWAPPADFRRWAEGLWPVDGGRQY